MAMMAMQAASPTSRQFAGAAPIRNFSSFMHEDSGSRGMSSDDPDRPYPFAIAIGPHETDKLLLR